jgi:hypothetical protein
MPVNAPLFPELRSTLLLPYEYSAAIDREQADTIANCQEMTRADPRIGTARDFI